MGTQWFCARNNQQMGPLEWGQVQQMAASGALAPADMVWTEGMPAWAMAASVPGLFAAPAGAPTFASFSAPPVFAYSPYATPAFSGFWIRVVAWFLDVLILGLPTLAVTVTMGVPLQFPSGQFAFPMPTNIRYLPIFSPGWFLVTIMAFAYFGLMESSEWQATLGKLAVGIKVVDAAGNRLSLPHALGRYAAKYLCNLTLGIGYLVVAFTERKQGLHDIAAGTYVVRRWDGR